MEVREEELVDLFAACSGQMALRVAGHPLTRPAAGVWICRHKVWKLLGGGHLRTGVNHERAAVRSNRKGTVATTGREMVDLKRTW